MNCPASFNKAYNLCGGQTLSFREMVEAIFNGLGKTPRFVNCPKALASMLLKWLALTPAYRHLTEDMIERVGRDMCFDSSDACRDFGYSPRPFQYQESDIRQA